MVVIIGAALVPLGVTGTVILWQDYWLRTLSPSTTAAILKIAPPLLIWFVGVLAFVVGLVGLGPEARRRYFFLGLSVGVVVFLMLLVYFRIPHSIPTRGLP